jgi:hypothetical protein
MNNLFSAIKKILPGKELEQKAKEEEDQTVDFNLSFEVTPIKPDEILNYLVKDIKIGGITIDGYESYIYGLDRLMSQYKYSVREIDYRYQKYCESSDVQMEESKNQSYL